MPLEGQYSFKIYVEDLLGNNRTRRYVITVDDTPVNKPRTSLPSGSFYSSDVSILRCYFDEQPAVVIANWNNGTNQSLTIQSVPAMRFRIVAEEGSYYVIIELPTALFTTHRLTLYISDRAGIWVSFQYTYHKITSVTELVPLIFFLAVVFGAVTIWKRKPVSARLRRGIRALKTRMTREEQGAEMEKEEVEGDDLPPKTVEKKTPHTKHPRQKRQKGNTRKKGKSW